MQYSSFFCVALLSLSINTALQANTDIDSLANTTTEELDVSDQVDDSTTSTENFLARHPNIKKIVINAKADQPDEEKDPFESFNRKVHNFNDTLDRHIVRPIASQYVEKVPSEVRGSYHGFRKNLDEPWNAVNQMIQGKPLRAAKTVGRFTINTLTTLGLADPASRLNLATEDESIGTTLGYYGVPSGPYVVLPFFGPSTIRSTVGLAADAFGRPQNYMHKSGFYWTDQTLRLVDARAQLIPLEDAIQGDAYSQIRDIYLQRLNFQISEKKGESSESSFSDTDDFFDEETP